MNDIELLTELEELLTLSPDGPNVLAIGGGAGLSQALVAIQGYASDITAAVTVADDGGSSGRLIAGLDILPPGDLRRCLLALSSEPTLLGELFSYRFEGADVGGHSLGNLILAAMADIFGDFQTGLHIAGEALGALGTVLPVSHRPLKLTATVDGQTVSGQAAISATRGDFDSIEFEQDDVEVNPAVIDAVRAADQIVIGPGSLYTSLIAALIVPGLAEAINECNAQVVYVANLITQDGETLGLDLAGHIDSLVNLTGLKPDLLALVNTSPITIPEPHDVLSIPAESRVDCRGAELLDKGFEWPQHDPLLLGTALERIWAE